MRLLTVCPFVVCLILSVQSAHGFKMTNNDDNWVELFNQMDMFKNAPGDKHIQYMGIVYPSSKIKAIGQVGGLDVMPNGKLLVFHRGDRVWTYDSFNRNDDFNKDKYGPIQKETLTLIDTQKSVKIASGGENLFYMPHGLTIDHEGKLWLTDVGLHQVFKFDMNNLETPELILGVAFEHGNDQSHFCKPTDVAVSKSTGHAYVSDGYCNRRVVEFDKAGKFVKTFEDEQNPMFVVHSVTLIEAMNLVCTVSREEGRIVCFDITSGKRAHEIAKKGMNTVYAVKYNPNNQVLHAVTGDNHRAAASGFTFDASKENFGKFIEKWSADDRDLTRVHDLAISTDGSQVYLGQLNGEIDLMSYD